MFLKYEKFWILKHIWPQGFCIRIMACKTGSDATQRRRRGDAHSHTEIYLALPGISSWCQVHEKSPGIWRWMYSGWVKEHVLGIFFPKLVLLILQCVSEFPCGSCKNANSDLAGLERAWALAFLSSSRWGLYGWDLSMFWEGPRPGAKWQPFAAPWGELPLTLWAGMSLNAGHWTKTCLITAFTPSSTDRLLPSLPLPPHVDHATFCLHSISWLGSTMSHDSSLAQFQRIA